MKYLLLLPLFLACLASSAHAEDLWEKLAARPQESVLVLFEELSKIYRPSRKEDLAHAWILQLVHEANRRKWDGRVTHDTDAAKNILVRLPGTGRFANQATMTVALQAHFDMVLNSTDTDTPFEVQFANGVELARTGNLLHSKGFKTTLGADNGIGVAMLLKYLVDPTIEHPPLELVLTTGEEIGLVGAKAWKMPLKAGVMINLDWEQVGAFCHGCMGGHRTFSKGELRTIDLREPTGQPRVTLELKLSGLASGHSGMKIHEKRMNAILVMTTLLASLAQNGQDFYVSELKGGGPDATNVIPGGASALISVRAGSEAAIIKKLGTTFASLTALFTDEVLGAPKLGVETIDKTLERGVHYETFQSLAHTLLEVPNGVLTRDPALPEGVKTSSNLGYFDLSIASSEKAVTVQTGILTRSFDEADLARATDAIQKSLNDWPQLKFQTVGETRSSPWLVKPDSWIFEAALRVSPNSKLVLAPGGLELVQFMLKYPDMAMISFGPTINKPHEPLESMDIPSMYETEGILGRLLIEIGVCRATAAAAAD